MVDADRFVFSGSYEDVTFFCPDCDEEINVTHCYTFGEIAGLVMAHRCTIQVKL